MATKAQNEVGKARDRFHSEYIDLPTAELCTSRKVLNLEDRRGQEPVFKGGRPLRPPAIQLQDILRQGEQGDIADLICNNGTRD